MKNSYYEHIKLQFKKASHRNIIFQQGIHCHHSFSEIGPSDLTWWTDFGFIINGYYVSVAWIHPRTAYKDKMQEEAFSQAKQYVDFINNSVPIYQKLGNSRKKIRAWRTVPPKVNMGGIQLALKLAENNLQRVPDFVIEPSITVEWRKFGKFVSLCAPFEVRSMDDLASLTLKLRKILKHEVNFHEAFFQIRYNRMYWIKEFEIW